MTTVFKSHYFGLTENGSIRQGFTVFASREEAEKDQEQFDCPSWRSGIEEVDSEETLPVGEEWRG